MTTGMCGEEFNSKLALEYHIHIQDQTEQFTRPIFYNNSGSSVQIIKHALFRPKPSGRVPLECDFCDEIFTNRAVAVKHRKTAHSHLIEFHKKTPLPRILKRRRDRERKAEK